MSELGPTRIYSNHTDLDDIDATRERQGDADLVAENAKLRDEIKRRDELEAKLIRCIENDYGILFAWDPLRKVWLSECTDEYVTERERLDAENAKLRELAWTLANCAAGHGCDYCPINGGYGYVGELDMCESVHASMRELGVEVD